MTEPSTSEQNGPMSIQATITPKPEHVEDVEREMYMLAQSSRQEPGCLRYDLLRSERDGAVRIHVQERYRDMAAVQAHRDSPHYQAYREKAGRWFAQAPEVVLMSDMDVELGPRGDQK